MSVGEGLVSPRRARKFRSISEKHEIVELSLAPGASVAEIARVHGVNANQLFKWRAAYRRGELTESRSALLPISVAASEGEAHLSAVSLPEEPSSGGGIHIELPGRALISIEHSADIFLVRAILESLRK
jgi:transposase